MSLCWAHRLFCYFCHKVGHLHLQPTVPDFLGNSECTVPLKDQLEDRSDVAYTSAALETKSGILICLLPKNLLFWAYLSQFIRKGYYMYMYHIANQRILRQVCTSAVSQEPSMYAYIWNHRTSGPVNAHLTPGPGIYFNAFIHVYSPRAGAEKPLGTNVDVNRKPLSLCPFVASFKTISFEVWFKTHFKWFYTFI